MTVLDYLGVAWCLWVVVVFSEPPVVAALWGLAFCSLGKHDLKQTLVTQ